MAFGQRITGMTERSRQLLVLDLDETLIYAAEEPLERACDFKVGPYFVYKRPFVEDFLSQCAQWFDLAVWTTSSEDYAASIVRHIFPGDTELSFVWARERCTTSFNSETAEQFWIKDLKKLKKQGYLLSKIIVVDDSPEKLKRQYANLVRVEPFLGDPNDRELNLLKPFLAHLTTVDDVRKVEKRNWKQYVQAHCRVTFLGPSD